MTVPSVSQSLTGTGSGTSVVLSSWTPDANDLLVVGVDCRGTGLTPSVSGNGLTWNALPSILNAQNQFELHLFWAQGASPSSGSITVTLTGNSKPVSIIAARLAGVHTTTPIPANSSCAGPTDPPGDDNDMKCDLTTTAADSLALAFGGHRAGVFTVPAGETAVQINVLSGTAGDTTRASMWTEPVASPTTVTLGDDNDLDSNRDWAVGVLEIAAAAAASSALIDSDLTGNMQDLTGGMAA